ncbi:MAG: HAD family hydrolase [bacterium]|nr:HAD family hydrolase [bacterium]
MVKLNDIGLLIFDLDGTILQSDKATFKVIKKAFSDMGIENSLEEEDIRRNLGEPTEIFFRNILGPTHASRWKEVMEKYDPLIPEFAVAFPGAVETLETLKERGYKLALCSNCGSGYFKTVIAKLNIGQYFDYAECNGDNNLSKSEMIRKILNKFPGLKAAVIGDKIHDIEAARDNNAVAIGALYGYGKDEPKEADVTISKFPELLEIFN